MDKRIQRIIRVAGRERSPARLLSSIEELDERGSKGGRAAVSNGDSEEVFETGRQRLLSSYKITAFVEAARKPSVEKKLRDAFGAGAEVFSVERVDSGRSRAKRLAEAEDMVNRAAAVVEELQTEMQEWSDSIPQNLQDGQKASEVQEAVDELQAVLDQLQSLDFGSIYFPGMMG